ncbi:Bro-N domain-containing protein [uncultured Clostridium sp.]|uniref:BRO-N domain-containing protein n=1 Tax=uncultured Clostridium sp. TaxID=59620 RepID=UPI0026131024|nr:Bro-N domain-containing protein [uncultured Clostridium sp.]
MSDLITKKFKNKNLNSLIWGGEICWTGMEIAEFFGYSNKRKAINDCIQREKLKEGMDYKFLSGDELKEFKETFAEILGEQKFAPQIIIFYERGLYRFLAYTKMPLGIEFREWVASEVMPTLREKGYYVMEGVELPTQNIQKPEAVHNLSDFGKFSTEKMERYRLAFETAKILEPSLDKITKDPVYKFLFFKQIFVDAGLELPSFIEEELRTF